MLKGLVHQAQAAAAQTARKAAFGLGGALCLAVGLGFLTAAAWMLLVTITTPLNAALIVGGGFVGVGFILIAVASMGKGSRTAPPQATAQSQPDSNEMLPQMIAAFMTGVQAGNRARS